MGESKYIPIVRIVATLSILTGILVIMGWLFDIEILKTFIRGFNTVKFNTAVCLFLLGGSVFLVTFQGKDSLIWANIFAIIILFISGITLLEDIAGINIGIDEIFVKDFATIGPDHPFPGRMAPTTALCFVLMTFSIMNIRSKKYLIIVTVQNAFHLVTLIAFVALMGYLYDEPNFYKLSFLASMAVPTAILFFLLSIATASLHPSIGLVALFSKNEIGNYMARRLFPLVVVLLSTLGYLRLESHRFNWIDDEFGIALFTISSMMVCLFLITNTAKYLNSIDSRRTKAEEGLKLLNKTLEEKVKERAKKFIDSEEKFHKTFQMSPAAMILTDMNTGYFLEVNQAFVNLLGYSQEELQGKTSVELDIVPQEEREKNVQLLKQNGYVKDREIFYYTKTREKRTALISIDILEINGEKVAFTLLYDVTERKIAMLKLAEAKKLAEESVQAKERFMANMSHEIRTPMNAIIGFTNLIENTPLTKDQKQYLNFIKTSGENLLVLINDILDYSKIEAGMMQLEKTPFKIGDLFQSIGVMYAEKAREKNLKLLVEIDNDLPSLLIGDPTRLTQILINLLSNALKFTKEGSVKMHLYLVAIENTYAKMGIVVKDTGIGIPLSKQKEIFNRFVQASEETTRKYGGTGLGLSIVKSLIELQSGEITLESSDGNGTEFKIMIPYMIAEEEQEMLTEGLPTKIQIKKFEKTVCVLVAEDNIINQVLAKNVLSRFGCEVDIAENGGIALEMARNKKYDIILMDIQMPIMDGYHAAQRIREDLNLTTPIIAMTAHALVGEREKCISYGMTDYISKPFKQEVLYSLVSKYVV